MQNCIAWIVFQLIGLLYDISYFLSVYKTDQIL